MASQMSGCGFLGIESTLFQHLEQSREEQCVTHGHVFIQAIFVPAWLL